MNIGDQIQVLYFKPPKYVVVSKFLLGDLEVNKLWL